MTDAEYYTAQDTKHDLCDLSPCKECSTHLVMVKFTTGATIPMHYGTEESCQSYLDNVQDAGLPGLELVIQENE